MILSFDPPAPMISMNDRRNRHTHADVVRAWRERSAWAWIEAHPGVGPSGRAARSPAIVHTALPMATSRRRDPINFTPTVKAIVDGLVDAGAWPDDTPEFVEQRIPTLYSHASMQVVIRVEAAAAVR